VNIADLNWRFNMSEKESGDNEVNIKTLFEECKLENKGDGTFDCPCPQCGLWGGRTNALVLNIEKNTAFCRSSQKWFTALEAYAMKKGIIKCLDGREKGQKQSSLTNDNVNETISCMQEEYDIELYNELSFTFNLNDKPQIIQPGTGKLISIFCREVGQQLKDKNEVFYRPGSSDVVEIGKIKLHKNGEDHYTGFQNISSSRFITKIEKYISPCIYVLNPKTEEYKIKPKSITKELSTTLLESSELQQLLPQINRIFTVQFPIMYEGKLTFPIKGYDVRFGSWLPYNAPEINLDMSLEEAKKVIDGIFSEFCFSNSDPSAKTNAIAGLLTPFLRGLYTDFNVRTPIFCYIGNRERVGKDYCAGITGIIYEGFALDDSPISTSENSKNNNTAELGKKILGAMMSGRKRLHFANNKGHIDNAVLEAILTSKKWSDRILSKNKNPTLDNEIEFSMSGNIGISYTPDFMNRARFVRLFLEQEDANARIFTNPNLHNWVLENRSLILSALYTLVKTWDANGRHLGKVPFTSFPEWATICGGIMETCGYDSPCIPDKESVFVGVGGDSETSDMKRLFEICFETYPNKSITKQVVRSLASENELFPGIDFNHQSGVINFSNRLNKYVGRIFSDIKMNVANPETRPARREMIFTKSVINGLNSGSVGSLGSVSLLPKYENKNNILLEWCSNCTMSTNTTKPKVKVKKIRIKKEVKKNEVKEERQIQFWDHPETKDIAPTCKEDDILEFIRVNPGTNYKEIYTKFRMGSIRFKAQLIETGLVVEKEGKLFMGEIK
jgi:hypothetical protein